MTGIQTIATAASRLRKKPSKVEAFEIVESAAISEGRMSEEQLAVLYVFFMPTITKIKSPFHWCVKAKGKKDVRYYLNHVYSDGVRTMATDGHRLHVINEVREKGWYDNNDQLIHQDGYANYPDMDRVIPSGKGFTLLNFDDLSVNRSRGTDVYLMPDGHGINIKHMKEALALSNNPVLKYFTTEQRLLIEHDNGFAVVMAIRM